MAGYHSNFDWCGGTGSVVTHQVEKTERVLQLLKTS